MATDLGKVGMRMRGTWDSSTAYEVLDAVSYNGGLYIAKQDVPANTIPTNTTYWQSALTMSPLDVVSISSYKSDDINTLDGNLVIFGKLCILSGFWMGSVTSNNPILTLPSEYKPATNTRGIHVFYNPGSSSFSTGFCTISSNTGNLGDSTTGATKTSGCLNITYYRN